MQKNLIKTDFFLFKGVSAWEEGNRLAKDALYYAENSRFTGGRWGSRKGYEAFGTAQAGGTSIRGLTPYLRFPSGVETPYVVTYYNSTFRRFLLSDATSVGIAPAGWTAGDVDIEGVTYNGASYFANGVDDIGKIDNITWSTIVDSPNARLLATWAEKMWAVDNAAPATAQYTRTSTSLLPLNVELWTGAGSGAQLIGKGGRIESMQNLNEKLYTFKRDQIDVFANFYTDAAVPVLNVEPISKNTGAINHRAVTIVENDIWFLTPNLEIRSLGKEANYFNDPRTEDMSYVIQRHKRDLDPDQSGAVAWYNDGVYKLALQERGSSQNNLIFTYDRDTGGWGFDQATSPQVACTVDGRSFFAVSGTSGQIYEDESSYTDNGFAMSWGGRTGLHDDGRPDIYKYGRYLYIRGARSENVVITAYLLGEDFARLETNTVPVPTAAEIAAGDTVVAGDWGMVGDIVGGGGYTGAEAGAPPVYRFNRMISISSTARMFGVEFESSINSQRIFIDEVKLKYIPRPEGYTLIDS